MLLSQIPYKFLEIFGKNASGTLLTTPIPQTTGSGIRASQDQGFPLATATPIGSGGTPPDIRDFNGIFQYLSSWSQWVQSGGAIYYDSVFSAAIGGYPIGSVLSVAGSVGQFWISTMDGNTTNPDTGGAGWTNLQSAGGDLAGYLPSPTIKASVNLTGNPTLATNPAANDNSQKLVSSSWLYGAMLYVAQAAGFLFNGSSTGWLILPSWLGKFGLQWGVVSIGNAPSQVVTMGRSFATTTIWAGCSYGSIPVAGNTCGAAPANASQIVIGNATTGTNQIWWLAIGY